MFFTQPLKTTFKKGCTKIQPLKKVEPKHNLLEKG